MAAFGVDLLGTEALHYRLSQIPRGMEKQALRSVFKKSATRLKKRILPRIPVDTGALKKFIKGARPIARTDRRGVRVGIPRPPDKRNAIKLNVLEYGRGAKIRRGRWSPGLPALAIIRRTVNENTAREYKLIAEDLERWIDQKVRSMAR